MKKLSSLLLLALTGGLACGATDGVPAHIVQPLPKELDPRLEPPLAPPSGIVRPLTAEETARRERELAPVPTAGLKEDGEKAIEAYNVKEKTVDGQIPPAAPGHRQCRRPGCGHRSRCAQSGRELHARQFLKQPVLRRL